MAGKISHELEVNVPANDAWELFGTLGLAQLVEKELSHVIAKIDVIEGDGGVGTVLKLTYPPDTPGFTFYREKFVKIDNENRVKEAIMIEGGYLELGFTSSSCVVRFELKDKGVDSCIIITTIEYDVKEEAAANASLITIRPLANIVATAAYHLIKNKN